MTKITEFESKKEKYVFLTIVGILLLLVGVLFYPSVEAYLNNKYMSHIMMDDSSGLRFESAKSPDDFYKMFQCSCCGEPIDTGCCGMATQRKEYVDQLLLDGLDENEIKLSMVKKFGFEVLMDKSMEDEIKDYIKNQAPDNPPKIEFDIVKKDLGTIHQQDGVVSTTFLLKNIGGSDLIIENMDTSCMCTSATLTYDGKESPEFGMSMHGGNPDNFELIIPPGELAQLEVFYDPMAHGIQETAEMKIIRYVTIISNDPVDFQSKVTIVLTQLK